MILNKILKHVLDKIVGEIFYIEGKQTKTEINKI